MTRTGCLRVAAGCIGLLGIVSLVIQLVRLWPPNVLQLEWLGGQFVVLVLFLKFGFAGWPSSPIATRRQPSQIGRHSDSDEDPALDQD